MDKIIWVVYHSFDWVLAINDGYVTAFVNPDNMAKMIKQKHYGQVLR